jgi:hypothetical protein
MDVALGLLLVQGALGALDTLWYHEWMQHLPTRAGARRELRLHASRDFAYAIVFGSLGWVEWQGWFVCVLAAVLLFEIVITCWDFIEEDQSRPLPPGERVMHTVMAIVYGAFLANLIPHLVTWSTASPGFRLASYGVVSWFMSAMALGVFVSGIRDLVASFSSRSASNSETQRSQYPETATFDSQARRP